MQCVGPPACGHALALIVLQLWANSRSYGGRKLWLASNLREEAEIKPGKFNSTALVGNKSRGRKP